MKCLTIMAIFLMQCSRLAAQQDTLHSQTTFIRLNGETQIKEVKMPLRDSLNSVNLVATAMIGSGSIDLEIYDPAGKKQGNFSLACEMDNANSRNKEKLTLKDIDESDQKALGNLYRTIKNPLRGAWIAKVKNNGAIGTIQLNFTQKSTQIKGSTFTFTVH
jgi:hypothetical protein